MTKKWHLYKWEEPTQSTGVEKYPMFNFKSCTSQKGFISNEILIKLKHKQAFPEK